jgi:hypothetical protein
MQESRIRALILLLAYGHRVSYYDDWLDAFVGSGHFLTETGNIIDLEPAVLARRIEEFDAVILLHGCNADTLEFLEPLVPVLADRKRARLLSFVGNEYNSPYLSMQQRNDMLRRARTDIIATQLLAEAGEHLYAGTGARVISVPHALNPAVFFPREGPRHARIDIGVKGYKYPPWLGDDERNRFLDHFRSNVGGYGLNCDIGVDERVGRDEWAEFLRACNGTISTEVGSWYISPSDDLIDRVYEYLKSRRGRFVIGNESPIRRMARHLPMPVKSVLWRVLKTGVVKFEVLQDSDVPFAELEELFFPASARAPVYGKAISSRHFDAIGVKTCQIMLRGRYNDILEADKHYIGVDHDYANLDEAVRRFKDAGERDAITGCAFEHVMAAHTYAHRTAYVHAALGRA